MARYVGIGGVILFIKYIQWSIEVCSLFHFIPCALLTILIYEWSVIVSNAQGIK